MIRWNLDPTTTRVVVIASLLCLKDIIIGLLVFTKVGTMPTMVELCTILLSAALTLVIYILAFLQTGEVPLEEE